MRRAPVSFAYNAADKSEDDYLGFHRQKPPKVLGKEAKEEGAGPKYAFGTAQVEGKILSLTCERVVPGLAKKLKRYLKTQRIMLNVQILDETGAILESDIEELPDDPELFDDDDPAAAATPAAAAAPAADGAAPKGRVAKRVFLLERWKKIPGELSIELGALNKSIASKVPVEDPDDFCKGVEDWFGAILSEMQTDLTDAIDESINAGDDSFAAVGKVINGKFRPRIASDRLVQLFKKGSLLPGSPFEEAFEKAFAEIETGLRL
ncbi:hypothetical protein [Paragemmobacter straminiformis]|uniref:Uncharacterized protein n=1 Tax=Paragemmobacter straminiformis TaxID=2045119 RepID=A0A842IBU4_9RHOB|nr:hypothetical protein [Gemmobacter straminiformis]MBC2836458.1 hypothetical protein [Gemmobacter straminiformis]